ncbi:MAG: helix-turn-helix domain-containing protein [Ilumatobacteraceae bacterium]
MGDADQTAEPERPDEFDNVIPLRPADRPSPSEPQPALRSVLGEVLRDERVSQDRTLADVAGTAAISLPYLSEIERGRKEVSSDLLGAVCGALDVTLVEVLERCVDRLRARAQGGSGIQLRAA